MRILKELEDTIISADRLNDLGVPSASIAILDDGQISASVITNGNENTDTVYQACSISKAITALAVARLVDEGRISYGTKIVDHLSESSIQCLADAGTRHLLQYITVAMLLSHTSGLSQGGFPGYAGDAPSAEDIIAGRPPSNTPRVRVVNFPGVQWSYSGGGFTVLQLVLEHATKTPFAQLMQDTVLQPLGMTRSWYGSNPAGESNYAKAYSTGTVQYPGALDYHNLAELAAAGLWTTPTDMLKAILAVQEAQSSTSGFLKQETAEKMLTRISPGPQDDGIGLGWFVNNNFFAHSGSNDPGYNTWSVGFRGGEGTDGSAPPRSGLAVMTNSSLGHSVAIKQMTSALFYLKGWQRFRQMPSKFGKDSYVPYEILDESKMPAQWKEWVGSWGSDWRLVDQDGSPTWQYKSMDPMRLSVAAAPTEKFDGRKEEVFFVVRGMRLALRLTWVGGRRVVQRLHEDSWGRTFESELSPAVEG